MTIHREPHESILDSIGNTPLVVLDAAPTGVTVYAKLETFIPAGA